MPAFQNTRPAKPPFPPQRPARPMMRPSPNPDNRGKHLGWNRRPGAPKVSGETSPEWEFIKTNKWYLLGGALLCAGAVAYFVNKSHAYGHDF